MDELNMLYDVLYWARHVLGGPSPQAKLAGAIARYDASMAQSGRGCDPKRDAEAPETPEGSGGVNLSDGTLNLTSEAPERSMRHSGGIVDPTRQDGTGNAAPKRALGAPEMSIDEASDYLDKLVWWRAVPSKAGQALLAHRREIARIRAALPEIIGCAHGEGAACNRDAYGWSPCCATRLRVIAAGLIPAPEHAAQHDDGA